MKPSDMKKDVQTCVRINKEIRTILRKKGQSAQKIVDEFIDKKITINNEIDMKGNYK